ncbi:hypothetical protein PYW08_012136 [Mythimna loreyi]|uniref:Uncharacterized protein n=1 Tax=Mythimna loreyi TaxID=667449 RepID=A0ACC2PZK3_9NEOP|nr:hypothetical protein PYW08_012136 [Mythimna loreyi]
MKFFIFLCCVAHFLSGTSTIRLTTPMSSVNQKHWYDNQARQVSKFAVMIDFVNNVYTEKYDDSFFRRHSPSKHRIFRRFDRDTNAKDKMAEPVRYHIIKNPEILFQYKSKQDLRKNLDAVNVFAATTSFSTTESQLNNYQSQIESAADSTATTTNPEGIPAKDPAVNIRAHQDDEDGTTEEVTYQPSFPDEDDDDKPNTKATNLKNHKKVNIKTKPDKTDHKTEKKNQNSKLEVKNDKNKSDTNISNKNSSIKNKHSVKKLIDTDEKLNKKSVQPKDKNDDKINKKDGITNKDSDKNESQSSSSKNERYPLSVEGLISNIDKNINNHRIERHFNNADKDRSFDSNKHYNNKDKYDAKNKDKHHDKAKAKKSLWIKVEYDKKIEENEEKEDKNDKWNKKEYDRNTSNKNDKGKVYKDDSVSYNEKNVDKTNDKFSIKENNSDKSNEKLNKKEKERDKNHNKWNTYGKEKDNKADNWTKKNKIISKYINKETDFDTNDDKLKKRKDRNKMDKQRDHLDNKFDKMEYEWNKRHQDYDINANDAKWINDGNQGHQNDKEFKEKDNEFKKRDNYWAKRDDDRNIRQYGRTNIERNVSPNQNSEERIEEEKHLRHGRYKIVDRRSKEDESISIL